MLVGGKQPEEGKECEKSQKELDEEIKKKKERQVHGVVVSMAVITLVAVVVVIIKVIIFQPTADEDVSTFTQMNDSKIKYTRKGFIPCSGYVPCNVPARAKMIVLDQTLVPNNAEFPQSMTSEYIKDTMTTFERSTTFGIPLGSGRKPVGNKTYLFGTNTLVSHSQKDKGFLSIVFEAYAKHLTLVTSPEDWWLTVVQRVAQAVDKNSGKESVRNHFVTHDNKKKLVVDINDIYDIKEAKFFSKMSELVQENINDPGYVTNMQADFTTTTPLHGIVFNIAMMSSLQEFFEFVGRISCGIPQLEMKGTFADWEKLVNKFSELRERLEPVSVDIGLPGEWWAGTQGVLGKLLETYNGKPDKGWWKQIFVKREVFVVCGTATEWDGWFLKDFLGLDISEVDSSLVSVPLTIDDLLTGIKTDAALVAGIAGFKLKNNQTSIEAQHAWNLMMPPTSYFRKDKL